MKIGSYSETLMRLEVQGTDLLETANTINYSFTGTGINFLTIQSYFNNSAYLIGVLPNNQIGSAALKIIRANKINEEFLKMSGHEMAMYILENGFDYRASEVLYQNRNQSAHNTYQFDENEVDEITSQIDAIHVCGIGLAINEITRSNIINLCKAMHEKNKDVYFDFNYRSTLWKEENYEYSSKVYKEILMYCNIVSMSEKDATRILGYEHGSVESLFKKVCNDFNVDYILGTKRKVINTSTNIIKGYMYTDNKLTYTKEYEYYVNDRIGAGDAYFSYIIGKINCGCISNNLIDDAVLYCIYSQSFVGDVMPLSIERFEKMKDSKGLVR